MARAKSLITRNEADASQRQWAMASAKGVVWCSLRVKPVTEGLSVTHIGHVPGIQQTGQGRCGWQDCGPGPQRYRLLTAMETGRHCIPVEALTAEAFAPFGDVIEAGEAARQFTINEGFATRYHDLARIDVLDQGGRPILNIFRAVPRVLPMQLRVMERHPLGSQAFVPLNQKSYLVVVAPASTSLVRSQIRCFLAQAEQGVNYAKGTWHHPLIAIDSAADFLVVDRGGRTEDHNLDEVNVLEYGYWIG